MQGGLFENVQKFHMAQFSFMHAKRTKDHTFQTNSVSLDRRSEQRRAGSDRPENIYDI